MPIHEMAPARNQGERLRIRNPCIGRVARTSHSGREVSPRISPIHETSQCDGGLESLKASSWANDLTVFRGIKVRTCPPPELQWHLTVPPRGK